MNDKNTIITLLRGEFNRWEDLLARMSEAQLTAPISGSDRSIKDVIAHLRAWQQVSIARMEAALHNSELALPDWLGGQDPESEAHREQFNATINERNRDVAWPEIYRRRRDGFLRLIALSEQVPERDMLTADRYAWIEGYALIAVLEGSLAHHREHREEIDASGTVLERKLNTSAPSTKPLTMSPATIDEYIAGFPPDVQEILHKVRATIRKAAPDAQEVISYRMPAFRQHGILVYFAAFKKHIGLFPPVRGDAKLEEAISVYAGPKGNLWFPLDKPIPYALIGRIMQLRVKQDRAHAQAKKAKR